MREPMNVNETEVGADGRVVPTGVAKANNRDPENLLASQTEWAQAIWV